MLCVLRTGLLMSLHAYCMCESQCVGSWGWGKLQDQFHICACVLVCSFPVCVFVCTVLVCVVFLYAPDQHQSCHVRANVFSAALDTCLPLTLIHWPHMLQWFDTFSIVKSYITNEDSYTNNKSYSSALPVRLVLDYLNWRNVLFHVIFCATNFLAAFLNFWPTKGQHSNIRMLAQTPTCMFMLQLIINNIFPTRVQQIIYKRYIHISPLFHSAAAQTAPSLPSLMSVIVSK